MKDDKSDVSAGELENAMTLFKKTNRLHQKIFGKSVCNLELNRSQHMLLMHLVHHDEVTSQRELASQLEISPPAIAVVLKRLEKDGYIERTANQNDSRYNRISVTDKGRELAERTHKTFRSIDLQMFDGLSRNELTVFSECLEKMHENLKHMCESGTVDTRERKD